MSGRTLDFQEFRTIVGGFLGLEVSDLRPESNIYQEIGIDSLGLVNLGVKIQKRFGITIPAAAVIEIRTIGELYEAIRTLVEQPRDEALSPVLDGRQ